MTAIVILGASVRADGPSPALMRRTLHAATLYRAGMRIIPSGGLGPFPPSEAEAMRTVLLQSGVPGDAIVLEPEATTTFENLRNARRILEDLGETDVMIVTDSYHAPRTILVAWALGLRARIDAPQMSATPLALRIRRAWHEAVALPGYAICLPWWLWRDRS